MQAISATDSPVSLSALLSQAQREPVMIRRNQRDVAVMLSVTEYHRLHGRALPAIDARLAALLDGCD